MIEFAVGDMHVKLIPVEVKPGSKVQIPVSGCSFLMSTNLLSAASWNSTHRF